MNQREKAIYENFQNNQLGIHSSFRFRCTMCGKCCINREDILLNAKDIYHLAKILHTTCDQIVQKYGDVYLGKNSRVPIVRLRPVGSDHRCPFLQDNKCTVHELKPTVCALFPLGRAISFEDHKPDEITQDMVQFFFCDPNCGDNNQKHTVLEWMIRSKLPIDDEFFLKWQMVLMKVSDYVRATEKEMPEETFENLNNILFFLLYLAYDTQKDFMPQFIERTEKIGQLFDVMGKYHSGGGNQ